MPKKPGRHALSNPLPAEPRNFCCVSRLKAIVSDFESQRKDEFSAIFTVSVNRCFYFRRLVRSRNQGVTPGK
jgi:hypothetical protein